MNDERRVWIARLTRDEIDARICQIMMEHGPDRHIDGHEVLTDYVMSIIAAERQTCAEIAEAHPGACQQGCDTGEEIASKIRTRGLWEKNAKDLNPDE